MSTIINRSTGGLRTFRHLLMALTLTLTLFALPAMAADDCWTLSTSAGDVGRYLQVGTPEAVAASSHCHSTYGAVAGAVYGVVSPLAAKPQIGPVTTSTTQIVPQGCTLDPDYAGYSSATCRYQSRTTQSRNSDPTDTTVLVDESYFTMLMTCGERYHSTAIGATQDTCKPILEKTPPAPASCGVHNPIEPMTGTKRQPETLFNWGRGHTLAATYWSSPLPERGTLSEHGANSFGRYWFSNLHRQMMTDRSSSVQYVFQRGLGVWKSFPQSGAVADVTERDPKPQSPDNVRWQYRDETEKSIEVYEADGRLSSIAYIDGRRLDYTSVLNPSGQTFSEPRLFINSIRDEAGRLVSFQYRAVDDKYAGIQSITDPAGVVLPVSYDTQGNLTSLTYADQTTQQFLYENASFPHALTGRVDESGNRIGTYRYDDAGRAIWSQTGTLPPWTVRWDAPPPFAAPTEVYDPALGVVVRNHTKNVPTQATVTSSDGRESVWNGTVIGRSSLVSTRSQPAGSGCSASTSSSAFDLAGNVTQSDDFNGNRSCMTYDATRNLELTRVEGLPSTTACSAVNAASYATGARMISTQWHPDWRMAVRTAEPRRITTLVYNGQPDPFNGGVVASCAPATALLPDGKPIVVLCKRAEQATTDETGEQGFNATAQAGVAVRATSWTYDATGLVLTQTDPLGTVVVTNEYYADTTADHTKGDLKSTTNAAGLKTSFTRYNAYGQPLEMLDLNKVSTVYAYDARQRLTVSTSAGVATSYDYWPTGLLKRTSLPDGSAVNYEYDDAGRLKAVVDSAGNRVEYTLDASGNRTQEVAKDASGALKRTMSRVFDALGRAQQTTGRE